MGKLKEKWQAFKDKWHGYSKVRKTLIILKGLFYIAILVSLFHYYFEINTVNSLLFAVLFILKGLDYLFQKNKNAAYSLFLCSSFYLFLSAYFYFS